MSKDYQDLHSLDPHEEGVSRSGYRLPPSALFYPSANRSSRLLYSLFALCALLLTVIIIVVAVNNSSVKETQKKQEQNLSNFSMSVQSHFQAVRSDEGNMQERLNNLEDAIKKLQSDKSVELVEKTLQSVKNAVEALRCDLQRMANNDSKSWCCPEDWVEFSGSCYFFSKEGRSWEDSKKFCASESPGAYMVVLNTALEQEFVEKRTIPRYTWIGLTDVDGDWKWVDGTSYTDTPQNWIPGQPDEHYGHGLGGGEDCAHLHLSGQWNDDHCSRTYNVVCEKKMSTP
ncbi:asialoglycoprotein receptor 1-like [Lissotriton helveticus]